MNVKGDDSFFLGALQDALAQRRAADFRKECDDLDSHLREKRPTPNPPPQMLWRGTRPRSNADASDTDALQLLYDFEDGALAVARRRTGEQRANCMNGLAASANHTANILASKLQFKDSRSAARNFRQCHIVRKFNQLPNDELEKLPHASKN